MTLRIIGGLVAAALFAVAIARYRRGLLRRGELLVVAIVAAGLTFLAVAPTAADPLLGALGFEPGKERRIIGLLVISNFLTFALLLRSFTRDDTLSNEVGDLVDYMALRRLEDEGWPLVLDGCAVVIPAYNEAENLPSVLRDIPKTVEGLPVITIVVADGCTDDTEATAKSFEAVVIRRELRRGSGAAVRLGYQAALRIGARVIVTMDADGQHDPAEMGRLVGPIVHDGADMVQGSRVLGRFEIESKLRHLGVAFFSRLLTALSRTKITDPSNGYRSVKAEALQTLDLRQEQFYVSEMILEASRRRLDVREVPITVRRRASGSTKKPSPAKYAWGFARAIARTWFRQPPGTKLPELEPRWISNAATSLTQDPAVTDTGDTEDTATL
jgi:hypothetical protein